MNGSTPTPGRRRPAKNTFTTKSGQTVKLNRSLGDRIKASREEKARKRAAYMATLPKNRFKRILYRLHPKRVVKYWFSREGAIMALKITGIGIVAGFILLVGVFAYFRKDLPNIKDISGNEIGGTISYYDRTGGTLLWQDYDAINRIPVTDENISKYLKQATIAIEDKDFYKHGAFDVSGIARAGYHDIFKSGGGTQGGSTITQQLVKLNMNWTQDRSLTRKAKELILAVELEREYSKQDILVGYLNIAPYSGVEYGAESAARNYFNKAAKDLTLPEASMLAAIPKSPTHYSPYSEVYDKDDLLGRQHYILDQMVDQKMITKAEAEAAKKVDVVATVQPRKPKYDGIRAPYFVLSAKQELEKKYSEQTIQRGGWKVITTLDMGLQTVAEQQVASGIKQVQRQGGDSAAFVAEDVKTGQIVSLVGGIGFEDPNSTFGKINFARTKLPPGSSFKPYDYAALIDSNTNIGAGSVLYDTQGPLEGYPCTKKGVLPKNGGDCLYDYDFNYPGPITLRYSLGGSRNVPAIKAMLTVGINKTIQTAEKMGLKSGYKCYPEDETYTIEGPCYASSAIGDGAYLYLDEHVNGYGTLSRGGVYIDKTYILKISDSKNKTIYEWEQPKGEQVIKPDTAYILTDMLADPDASYLPQSYKAHRYKGWHFGFKTGTTNDNKDGWMMGVSSQYAAGVWVGYHNRTKEMTGSMETMTQPILKGWLNAAHDNLTAGGAKVTNWTPPAGLKTLPAFVVRSKVSARLFEKIPSPATDIFPSWYQNTKQSSSNQTIDKVSGKVATSCTPELAKQDNVGGNSNAFSVDIFVTGANSSTATGTDDAHKCDDAKPTITLTAPDSCGSGGSCSFTATVTKGTADLSSAKFAGAINLKINGQQVQSQPISDSPSTVVFTYVPTASGDTTVQVEVIDSLLYNSTDSKVINMTTP